MSEKINDGGAAFPAIMIGHDKGMTLRDFFAAKAMQGIFVNIGRNGFDIDSSNSLERAAEKAYKMADEMLKAREVQS